MRGNGVLIPLLFVALGCGGTGSDAGTAATGGQASGGRGTATGGTGSATGGVPSTGGGSTEGGNVARGGTATATGGTATTTGGTGALVDCDLRKITCRIATPACPTNQAPSVSGTCYGPCTRIESCACTTAGECPDNDQYTCWSRMHCGPYVD